MHRTFSVPRLIGCLSLVLALALHAGLQSAAAQLPKGISEPPVIVIAVGATQSLQMTTKLALKKAVNPNAKVLLLTKVQNDLTASRDPNNSCQWTL